MENEPPQQNLDSSNQPTNTSLPNSNSIYLEATHSGYSTPLAIQIQKPEVSKQPKNKYGVTKIILILLLTILTVGLVDGIYTHLKPRLHQTQGAIVGHGYSTHTLSVGGQTIWLSFDKSATSNKVDLNNTIFSGNDLVGNKIIVDLTAIPASLISPSEPCSGNFGPGAATVLGSVNILNNAYSLCGSKGDATVTKNNGIIGVHFQSKSQWYKLSFNIPPNASYSVDINTAKQVAQSISVQ